ncbi:MAG: phosphotransferase [Chloroflexota bacterium]|nr:phosphotransferase [Chloroflexota bacterium]
MPDDCLDTAAILRELGITESVAIARVTGGRDTAVYRVHLETSSRALRVYGAGQGEGLRREVAVMEAAREGGIPAPPVYAVDSDSKRPALLMEWCRGRPVADELKARPWRARHLGVLFGRMHAAIHGVRAPRVLRDPSRSWIAWARDEALGARLGERSHRGDALLHLDYHPLNVMTDGGAITGVLDWTNARAGDPRADYARTLSILRLDAEVEGRLAPIARLIVRRFEQGWQHGYREVAGELADLAPYLAWAGTVMQHDRSARPGVPGGLTPERLDRVRAWTSEWMGRAGWL